jgi:hypothetical protein
LDRLKAGAALVVVFVAAACGGGGRPRNLLDGSRAAQLGPVPGSVLARGRVVLWSMLGDRLDACLTPHDRAWVPADAAVVERVGVDGESATFATRNGAGVYACDGGVDPAGERSLPWCGIAFGERHAGRLLDPRLDVNCRDRSGRPLAYAFVEPVAGAHWIGVRQNGYVELYEVLAGLPVRIATTRGIRPQEGRATIGVTQYDASGAELLRGELEAAVAG